MFSKISYLLSTALILYASFIFYPKWNKSGGEAIISWDVYGYYSYLPALFIYKDIKRQSFIDSVITKYSPADGNKPGFTLANGNEVMKYSSGMALMYMPFFIIANTLAQPLGYPQDGYSPPYQFFIQLGGVLIALIGLWYFRKMLLLFYTDKIVAVSLLLLVFGTNYLDFSAIDVGMSHSWLFTIYVFLLFTTINFYKTYSYKYAIFIGILVGLATLTRPTDIISCLIPLLWGLESISLNVIKTRFAFLIKHLSKLLAAGICAFIVISVQLFYWKYVSGHWFVYSYEKQGFSFRHPHFADYTFSFESGWLVYTPVMIFAFIGIIPFLRSGKNKVAILSFFILNYYIVSSWDIWWYGGRAMIQSYPMLFFPLTCFIEAIFKKRIIYWLISPVILLFTYFNLWVIYQYHAGGLIIPGDFITNVYFWRVAGRWHVPNDINKLRDNKDYFEGTPKNMKLLYQNDFETDTTYCSLPPIDGNVSLCLDKEHKNSKIFKFSYFPGRADWIRAQATFHSVWKEWQTWKMPQFVVRFYKQNEIVKERIIRVSRFIESNSTKDIFIDVKVPDSGFDSVGIVFLNAESDQQILIDDLKVWSFD